MDAEQLLITKMLATSAISSVVASRVYLMKLPQGSVRPAITMQRFGTERNKSISGASSLVRASVAVHLWADTWPAVKQLANATRGLNQFAGLIDTTRVSLFDLTNETDVFEGLLNGRDETIPHIQQDWDIIYYEVI